MHCQVVISAQAEEDLSNIYSYVLNVLQSEINADSVLGRLYSAMEDLEFMSESYHLYPNEPWRSRGVRYFSVNNYSIFYVVNKVGEDEFATVIHVIYGRRDLDKALSEGN